MKVFFNILGVLFSIIITLILSVIIFSYSILGNVKNFTTEKNFNKIINQVDFSTLLKEIENGEFWDALVEVANSKGLNESDVKTLINSKELKNFVSKYSHSLLESAVSGTDVYTFTKSEYTSIFSKSIVEFNEKNNNKIDNQTTAQIMDIIEGSYSSVVESLPDKSEIQEMVKEEDLAETIKVYKFLLSGTMQTYFIITFTVLLGFIALLRFSYYKWIFYGSISLIFSSLDLIATGSLLKFLVTEIDVDSAFAKDFVMILKENVQNGLFITAVILFIIAIFGFFANRYFKKSKDVMVEETLTAKPVESN